MFPPRARDLRQFWFESPESLYGRFNFQRDEHIDALMAWLLDDSLPTVVVLGGDPGIGRSFLCDAAARRARKPGCKVAVWHLDLDGFEPDVPNPLTHYLRQLTDQKARLSNTPRKEAAPDLLDLAGKATQFADFFLGLPPFNLLGQASQIAASLLSLLYQFQDTENRFANLLTQPPHDNGAPLRDHPETLHRFLAELTRDRKLIVHVKDSPQLTSKLRRWLIREAEQSPERLLLVISCSLDQATEQVVPDARSKIERFDLQPLNAVELRNLLDRRFKPNKLPDDFVALLMRRSHGWPVAIANLLADLMAAELLFSEGETWRLPQAGMKDNRLIEAFSRGLFEEVDEPLATLAAEQPELASALRDLLLIAALCGRYVPMAALLKYLNLDESTAEYAIDWIDDVLVGELGWLTDLGFNVTGFSGHNVYAFTHPLLPLIILEQESRVSREVRASLLLRFLNQHVHVTKRAWARCFLSIAEHLGSREREPYERALSWWTSLDAADELQEEVREAIKHEEVDAELVWRVAAESWSWPAFRRLALLDGLAEATLGDDGNLVAALPFDLLNDFHLLRAELLTGVGRYADALDEVQHARRLAPRNSLHYCKVLNCFGGVQVALGDYHTARLAFEEALEIHRDEDLFTRSFRNNLAECLRILGDAAGARKIFERNLELESKVLDAEDPGTLLTQVNLGKILIKLGDFAGAKDVLEKALEVQERVVGAENPSALVARSSLASAYAGLGDFIRARRLVEETAEISRRALGPHNPDTLSSEFHLGVILFRSGDFASSKELFANAYSLQKRVLGPEHPNTLQSARGLAQSLVSLGEIASAQVVFEEIFQIQERVLGAKHPATTASAWRLLQIARETGDRDTGVRVTDKLRWLLEVDETSKLSSEQSEVRQKLLETL